MEGSIKALKNIIDRQKGEFETMSNNDRVQKRQIIRCEKAWEGIKLSDQGKHQEPAYPTIIEEYRHDQDSVQVHVNKQQEQDSPQNEQNNRVA